MVGFVSGLPLLLFGLAAPLGATLGRVAGTKIAVLSALALLTVGAGIRSAGDARLLIVGTVLIGLSLAAANVLVPTAIKGELGDAAPRVMGLFSAALTGGAALESLLVTALIAAGAPWRVALASCAIPAVLAGLIWWRWSRGSGLSSRPGASKSYNSRRLWREPTAWALGLFMGCQSLIFYALLTWIPSILLQRGFTLTEASAWITVFNFVGIVGALIVPLLLTLVAAQRWLPPAVGVAQVAAILAFWLIPSWSVIEVVMLGLVQGTAIATVFSLLALKSDGEVAARELSSVVLALGYIVACTGPIALGVMHDWSGAWSWPLASLVCVGMGAAALGLRVTRSEVIVR